MVIEVNGWTCYRGPTPLTSSTVSDHKGHSHCGEGDGERGRKQREEEEFRRLKGHTFNACGILELHTPPHLRRLSLRVVWGGRWQRYDRDSGCNKRGTWYGMLWYYLSFRKGIFICAKVPVDRSAGWSFCLTGGNVGPSRGRSIPVTTFQPSTLRHGVKVAAP